MLAACAGPTEYDVDAGPEAFWASCGTPARQGPIRIETASDVDSLAGVAVVDGDLVISGMLLDDLAGLEDLRCVRGRLDISENPALPDLDGLEGLVAVEDGIDVQRNALLTRIDALRGVRFVGPFSAHSDVSIVGNPLLGDLGGLSGLDAIRGDLVVTANDALDDLAGLDQLTRVAGDVTISRNETLRSTAGLDRLEAIGARLVVEDGAALEELTLPSLVSIDEAPTDVTGLFRGMTIARNRALSRVDLRSLERVEDVAIEDNPALASVDLSSLAAVPAETLVTGNLVITGAALTGVDLSALQSVGADFYVGGAIIERVAAPLLMAIGGDARVGDESTFVTPGTESVRALDLGSLASVGGELAIHNTALDTLAGLGRLEVVGGDLLINDNALLRSVELDPLRMLGGGLEVRSNPLLPTCAADAHETQLRDAGFTGRATIAANDDAATCP